jgi:8-oxo-dGTP diphosphatase
MPKPSDPSKHAYMFSDDMKFLQKAIVFHPKEDKLLILRRSSDSFTRPNEWDFPGGNVLFGEMAEESLRKEIREESGLEVTEIKPLSVITQMREEIYALFINYSCKASTDTVILSHEHSEYRWVTKEELMELAGVAQFLKDTVNAL